ncbi:MAG: hypothetical protein PHE27_02340 [Alphaproteobacteria bacterium]|nr:hypothetical protein [Alphaproteobacteria bacterium]
MRARDRADKRELTIMDGKRTADAEVRKRADLFLSNFWQHIEDRLNLGPVWSLGENYASFLASKNVILGADFWNGVGKEIEQASPQGKKDFFAAECRHLAERYEAYAFGTCFEKKSAYNNEKHLIAFADALESQLFDNPKNSVLDFVMDDWKKVCDRLAELQPGRTYNRLDSFCWRANDEKRDDLLGLGVEQQIRLADFLVGKARASEKAHKFLVLSTAYFPHSAARLLPCGCAVKDRFLSAWQRALLAEYRYNPDSAMTHLDDALKEGAGKEDKAGDAEVLRCANQVMETIEKTKKTREMTLAARQAADRLAASLPSYPARAGIEAQALLDRLAR